MYMYVVVYFYLGALRWMKMVSLTPSPPPVFQASHQDVNGQQAVALGDHARDEERLTPPGYATRRTAQCGSASTVAGGQEQAATMKVISHLRLSIASYLTYSYMQISALTNHTNGGVFCEVIHTPLFSIGQSEAVGQGCEYPRHICGSQIDTRGRRHGGSWLCLVKDEHCPRHGPWKGGGGGASVVWRRPPPAWLDGAARRRPASQN